MVVLLWKQFDESRLVTGRFAGFLDLHFFGGRNLSLQLELVLIPICLGAILVWMIRRKGGLQRTGICFRRGVHRILRALARAGR